MDRRVVITGCGVISSIGNNCDEVLNSLQKNTSGIEAVSEWSDYGLKSHAAGTIKLPSIENLRKEAGPKARFMDVSSIYALLCANQAIADSGLTEDDISSERTGCIAGSAFSNTEPFKIASDRIEGRRRKIGPFEVTRSITSSVSANLSNYFGIKGRSYSIGSACATSTHNIGHAYELIKSGECDVVLAGGAEEVSPIITCMFDGMRVVMSRSFNDDPKRASRPYDKDRDGFVISGGGGIVILEEYSRAIERKANIYGEIIGFGTSTDGHDIVQPDPDGLGCYRCMDQAFKDAGCSPDMIDYINTHGTSTTAGDLAEAKAISKLFSEHPVKISSTKSLTGHGIGAAGVHELVYCLLMMKENFVTASVNIENRDSEFDDLNIITENESCNVDMVLTNSFGFGGTNGSLIVKSANNVSCN
jgi:3-oxoacyl-[acyl-carrier-protein] synthase I